ncbi:sigma-54 interaction domain-containing protein [Rheinheimera aquimaris]|jgi:DNA-binding NtrC family response regulator|uniref:sigma-54 interaction domain-containing protein n=1 Tax=Rheinheimera aquimaris TaxID=412437 RepID=UPI001065A2A3|nr:sigma-54 dependent transcriptional regulator [Rheinheimera aquimaris]MCD1599677.1 sigma-54 dependent transcriptional regulator [Rheinheimera aquimaris]
MTQPRLFLHVHDPELSAQLLQSEIVRRFVVVRSSNTTPWSEQLLQQPCDLAFIQVDHESEADYQPLISSHLLAEMDFMFVSDGSAEPMLDELMRSGAGYHFRQPIDMSCILETLQDFYQQLSNIRQPADTKASMLDQFGLLVGSSRVMLKLYRTLRKVAVTDANVLVIGESGSGKELVANTLHLASYRAEQRFVAINCGALSPELVDSELFGHRKGAFTGALRDHQGVFTQAQGGTLFLDEITEMPTEQQVKLLRVLESGEFRPVGTDKTHQADVRVIAATNREPQQAIAEGLLREDLYFRLAQFPVHVPPLRDRGSDIIGLAQHFLAYRNAQEQQEKLLTEETMQLIASHNWPGNVRELKHAIERAYILSDKQILPEHLLLNTEDTEADAQCLAEVPCGVPLDDLEKAAILNTLEQNAGNKTDTAQQLGISVKTLYNKLEKYQQTDQ